MATVTEVSEEVTRESKKSASSKMFDIVEDMGAEYMLKAFALGYYLGANAVQGRPDFEVEVPGEGGGVNYEVYRPSDIMVMVKTFREKVRESEKALHAARKKGRKVVSGERSEFIKSLVFIGDDLFALLNSEEWYGYVTQTLAQNLNEQDRNNMINMYGSFLESRVAPKSLITNLAYLFYYAIPRIYGSKTIKVEYLGTLGQAYINSRHKIDPNDIKAPSLSGMFSSDVFSAEELASVIGGVIPEGKDPNITAVEAQEGRKRISDIEHSDQLDNWIAMYQDLDHFILDEREILKKEGESKKKQSLLQISNIASGVPRRQ